MNRIVSSTWLHEEMNKHRNGLVIIDVRYQLGDAEAGKNDYQKGHIPGAVFLDINKDLSAPVKEHGGRHPLLGKELLAQTLGKAGVSNDKTIVVYDDQGGMMAARLWWILTYLGHEDVAVLDGGYSVWINAGHETTTEVSELEPETFRVKHDSETPLVAVNDVLNLLEDENVILLDAREPKRYAGTEEPIDPVAGHIPGALNYFWQEVLTADGTWKSSKDLQNHFSELSPEKEIIVYCGSGISACPNILALKEAGYDNVKLYGGSWSDWVSYKENPVATGKS